MDGPAVLPDPELPGHVRDEEDLRADIAVLQLGDTPALRPGRVLHAEDPDPAGVLVGEPPHLRERAGDVDVVVVHEQEV